MGGWDHVTIKATRNRRNFNPPTPWGGGTKNTFGGINMACISIHPPRGGVGRATTEQAAQIEQFQSTHPVGGGTHLICFISVSMTISIHPPRGGVGLVIHFRLPPFSHFNPPTPWGGGTNQHKPFVWYRSFQSTHPVGGWDLANDHIISWSNISIHPPRGGVGLGCHILPPYFIYFNPPTPWGGGTTRC